MPIYAYKCGSCGHAKDVLQKLSDAPLTVCHACGAPDFSQAPHRWPQARSKRPRFITFVQAATKSFTNFSLPSALA